MPVFLLYFSTNNLHDNWQQIMVKEFYHNMYDFKKLTLCMMQLQEASHFECKAESWQQLHRILSWCFKSWQNTWWRIAHCFIHLLQFSCGVCTLFSIAWLCWFEKLSPGLWLSRGLNSINPICYHLLSPTQLLLQSHPKNHQIHELSVFERTKCLTDISLLNRKPHVILQTTALELVWIIFPSVIQYFEISTINTKKVVTVIIILKSVFK